MTDDTERRLRESLRGADLPAAPETLRASLHQLADSPGRVSARRSRLGVAWAVPALAAVVAVVVVAGALSGGFGSLRPAVSSTSPPGAGSAAPSEIASGETPMPGATATPTATPLLNAGVHIYSAAELQMLLTTDRASVAGRVVLVTGQVTHFIDTVCAVREAPTASTTCTAGWLADTDERVYVSGYTRQLEHLVAPDDPMTGTMAFKVLPDALYEPANGLEYLGRMGSGADGNGFQATLAELRSPWDASHALATFIVSGWLVAAQNMRCAAPAGPTPPPDTPFSGCGKAWLTPTPEQVMTVAGNEALFTPPMDGVMVQLGAYQDFARDPSTEFVREPRYGTYVVRLVVDTREGASDRVGWQVVARLDAGSTSTAPPSATPPTNTGVRIYTTAELVSGLTSDRKSREGKAVLVAGTVTRRPVGDSCDVAVAPGGSSQVCLFGALDGTSEDIYASSYTASLTAAPPGESLAGTFALRVLPGGLEFLAGMGHGPGGVDFTASIPDLVQLAETKAKDTASSGYIVVGWLVATPQLHCPPIARPAPPSDTPFDACPMAWLTPTAEQPTTMGANGLGVVAPKDGIAVQYAAYEDFAADPAAPNVVPEPRYGTYLVRLVVDTRQGPAGPVGWQVVARLAP